MCKEAHQSKRLNKNPLDPDYQMFCVREKAQEDAIDMMALAPDIVKGWLEEKKQNA